MEILEKRLAPAGLITAVLTGGGLKLTGDALDNSISIQQLSPEAFEITGLDGTLIKLGDAEAVETLAFLGLDKYLTVDLKDGADQVQLLDIDFDGSLSLAMGNGENQVSFGNLSLGGGLSVSGGKDNDTVAAEGLGYILRVAGPASFSLGGGDNAFILPTQSEITIGGAVSYTGGNGADSFLLEGSRILLGGGLNLKMGAGQSDLSISAAEIFSVIGSLSYDAPGQLSTVAVTAGDIAIGGALTLKGGAGAASTLIEAVGELAVNGAVVISHGNTDSINLVGLKGTTITLGESLTITNGTGGHAVSIEGATSIEKSLTITNSQGGGDVNIVGSSLTIGGGLTISNKGGESNTFITSDHVIVAGKISVTNGSTGGTAGLFPSQVIIKPDLDGPDTRLRAGAIGIINGAGDFETTIGNTSVIIGGSVVITNGSTSRDSEAAPGGTTLTSLLGDWHVQGGVAVTNGNGSYQTRIDDLQLAQDDDANSFFAGGGVSISNGVVAHALNQIAAGDFNARFLTIKNGNITALNTVTNLILARELRIGGALTIMNGNATAAENTIANQVHGERFELGSVIVKTGNSGSATSINAEFGIKIRAGVSFTSGKPLEAMTTVEVVTGGRLTIGGAFSVNTGDGDTLVVAFGALETQLGGRVTMTFGGAGDDTVSIGDSSSYLHAAGGFVIKANAGSSNVRIGGASTLGLNILGGVNVSALAGDDVLAIAGAGRITGGVIASFGAGDVAMLSIAGKINLTEQLLTVGGAVSMTAAAATARDFRLHYASVSGVTLTGGTGADRVELGGVQVRGALTLNLLDGNDEVRLDDVYVRLGSTIHTGAGADSILVESDTAREGGSVFHGAVAFTLGDNEDTLHLAPTGAAALRMNFLGTAHFDGGAPAGDNSLILGAGATFTSEPVFTNFPV